MTRPIDADRRRWVLLLAGLTALAGLGLSAGMGALLAREQHATAEQEFSRRTDLVRAAVSAQSGRYIDALSTVGAATGSFMTLTAAKYAQLSQPLRNMHLAGATSMVFLVPATDEQMPAIQSFWRGRGAAGLVLKPVGNNREHFFTIYATALDPTAKTTPQGTDASQAAAPAAAMNQARSRGRVTVSDTYQLISDRNQPVSQRQLSFVLTTPVYGPPDFYGHRAFVGWVNLGMHGQDFMGATLRNISQNLLDVTLRAQNADQTIVPVAALHASRAGARDLHQVLEVDVANRRWTLDLRAHAGSLPGAGSTLPITVTGGGSVLALLLAGLVYLLATGRDRAQAAVRVATADLREQKTLLEAIMDSIGDGIVVIDDRGEFLLTNPAAGPFLTFDGQNVTDNRWNEHVQLFRADAVTPFPAAELPLSQALAGKSSQGVEIVRRRGATEECILSVSARPLDRRADRRGAVGVFHDITTRKLAEAEITRSAAELAIELARREQTEIELRAQEAELRGQEAELRAREAELTAFAGMVAHDLKAPLRAVNGFTGILRQDLAGLLPGGLDARCDHSMERIVAASRRMSKLIDDLLAFATARDRVLHPQPVDLQALVAEVVAEYTSHLQAGAAEPVPVITVDPLPTVRADPVMCRQLLDNLIGNALKYAQPDQAAQIRIRARTESDQWIRVEIADRGVGIPAGKHEEIFLSFHRAHSGYSGTGLGLSICRRIVERHGGIIGADDHTGGGSSFHFTLPALALPGPAGDGPRVVSPRVGGQQEQTEDGGERTADRRSGEDRVQL